MVASFCSPAFCLDLIAGILATLLPPHRAFAAFNALVRRSSGVIVSRRLLPPILPPLRPIADITREISALLALDDLGRVSVETERETISKAAWFTS
jgi:hypothetical protein